MILDNINKLIQITEEVAYQDSELEFNRNIENLSDMIRNTVNPLVISQDTCGGILSQDNGAEIHAKMPSGLVNYGPGIASLVAKQLGNSVSKDFEMNNGVLQKPSPVA
jgi:hypothetical protein